MFYKKVLLSDVIYKFYLKKITKKESVFLIKRKLTTFVPKRTFKHRVFLVLKLRTKLKRKKNVLGNRNCIRRN